MVTPEKFAMASTQLVNQEGEGWMMKDNMLLQSDMFNFNMAEKEQKGHGGLAIRTRVVPNVQVESSEVTMVDSGPSEIKTEDGTTTAMPVKGFAPGDSYLVGLLDEAKALRLRKALADQERIKIQTLEPGMTEQETQVYKRVLAGAIKTSEAIGHLGEERPNEALPRARLTSTLRLKMEKEALMADEEFDENINTAITGFESYEQAPENQNTASKSGSKVGHYEPRSFNNAIGYLEKVKTRFASNPEVYRDFIGILKAFKAAPAPGPIQETHELVRKLFGNDEDLIKGFEEWLPKKIKQQQAVTIDPVAFESRDYGLEKKLWDLQNSRVLGKANGRSVGMLEKEMQDLKTMIGVLMIENQALRERVGQLDSYQAGPRWEVKQLGKEVEGVKEANHMMKTEIAALKEGMDCSS